MSSQFCEKIKVSCRIRPSKENAVQKVVHIENGGVTVNLSDDPKFFKFDGLYGEDSTQEEVFNGVASRIVEGTLHGYNGTIFAYGQTGSGKTHTMIGPSTKFDENSGIIPRGLHLLFEYLDKKSEEMPGLFTHKINIGFVEIYNEQIFDLLDMSEEKLKIGQDNDGNAVVKGATEKPVKDLNDAMEEVKRGWSNRSVAETAMNRASSRSHALLLIKIRTEEVHGSISTARSAFLNLVDLAGSERVSQSKVEGDRLKETANINKSLLQLKIVIRDLSEKKKNSFIAFRNSVLTHMLKDSLGGNARTAVMINVHPDKKYYSETLSTLQFAAEVSRIENKVVVNEDLKGDSVVAYKAEIRRLQEELDNTKSKNAEELAEIQRALEAWKEAAHKYERQLAVARRHAVNAAIVARKDGLTESLVENIWERSMAEVAQSTSQLPTSGIRSIQLKDLTEQLNLCTFERDELQTQLDDERKAKAEVQEKLKKYMEGAMSPVREKRESRLNSASSQGSTVSSLLGNPLEGSFSQASAKKDRRRTLYGGGPKDDRKSTFFRPVLQLDGDEFTPPLETENTEERREMELEMKINQKEQIIDEKIRESERLVRLLEEREKTISEAEEKLADAIKSKEEEKERVKELTTELAKFERTIEEEREKMVELEKKEAELSEQIVEANATVDRLQSDFALLKSTHIDEMKELERKLKSNLSDKEKKEVDMKSEIDRLRGDLETKKVDLANKEAEKEAADSVLTLITERLKSNEKEAKTKINELESANVQMTELVAAMENTKREREEEIEKSEEEQRRTIANLEEEVEKKRKEVERMKKREDTSSSELNNLHAQMGMLRIEKERELKEKMTENQKDVEHWKTVSLQFSGKIDEMKKEFESESKKRLDAESRANRMTEMLALRAAENDELKENVSTLGSHNNTKQKMHTFSRYVEEKRLLTLRVSQLEAYLEKHGIAVPHGDSLLDGSEDGSGQRDSLASGNNENGGTGTSRRPTRVVASSSTATSAVSSRTSVRSTKTAGARK